MSADVDALADVLQDAVWLGHDESAEKILDALPALLRADSPAGDALRERIGLMLTKTPWRVDRTALSESWWINASNPNVVTHRLDAHWNEDVS